MQVVYAKQEPPKSWAHSIFLAGPTPRGGTVASWRPEALKVLESLGYDGVVFVPEPENGDWAGSYVDQAEWETQWLDRVDRIVFWVPRDLETLPGFTTNIEFGAYANSGRAVLGHPDTAPKMRYPDWKATKDRVAIFEGLTETLQAAIKGWDDRPQRHGGARCVPTLVSDTAAFQAWHRSLVEAGNCIEDARVLWTFRIPKAGQEIVFSWVLWAKIWIAAEGRHKENEWVFARTDVACAVMYHLPDSSDAMVRNQEIRQPMWPSPRLLDIEVVLVREFRSPARTTDGFIRELPGGTVDPNEHPSIAAARETMEETGLPIDPSRFRVLGSRQSSGTLSAHHVHLVAVDLNAAEMQAAKKLAASGDFRGEAKDTEQTYVQVATVREILDGTAEVDWTTVGLVMRALTIP